MLADVVQKLLFPTTLLASGQAFVPATSLKMIVAKKFKDLAPVRVPASEFKFKNLAPVRVHFSTGGLQLSVLSPIQD